MIEEGRQNRPVALALERVGGRSLQELARLPVAECRRGAFVAVGHRTLDAVNRVPGNGIFLAEIIEQRRQCRKFAPDRCW